MKLTRTNHLKAKLRQLGVSQRELADAIGYSPSYVSEVLNGYRSEVCLKAIEAKIKEWEAEDTKTAMMNRR